MSKSRTASQSAIRRRRAPASSARAGRGRDRKQSSGRNTRRSAGRANARRQSADKAHAEDAPRTRSALRRPRRERPRLRALARAGAKFSLVAGIISGAIWGAHEAYDYATTSPRFEVRALIFEPTAHLDDTELRRRLGLERGTNILALEPEALAAQVLSHPWVAEAQVIRHLPDTLEVRVAEREARAVALLGDFFLVDDAGRPFKRADRGERGQLPIVTGISRADYLAQPEAARVRIASAIEAIHLYDQKQRPRLGEVHLEAEGGLTFYTAEQGTRLRLGRNSVQRGLSRYDALRAALGARADSLEVVHLDAETRPGERDRIVARFADPATERGLIAEAQLAMAESQATEELSPEPEAPAGKLEERRIPHY